MNYPLCIIFGVLPSIIWLLFYLRKDTHPEPKDDVIATFFYGALVAFLAVYLERWIFEFTQQTLSPLFLRDIIDIFLGVALVEEFLKYLVVRITVFNDPDFDEPVDAILYMMIAALGFAAVENILILFQLKSLFFHQTLSILILRFIGATFLHALSSGTIGFWLGLSFSKERHERLKFPTLGMAIAIFLHGLYNFSIIKGTWALSVSAGILIILALFLSYGFRRLKKVKNTI